MRQVVLELASKVFNEDGSVKNCGRECCIKLIDACEKYSGKKNMSTFGNNNNGMMDVAQIHLLLKELNKK